MNGCCRPFQPQLASFTFSVPTLTPVNSFSAFVCGVRASSPSNQTLEMNVNLSDAICSVNFKKLTDISLAAQRPFMIQFLMCGFVRNNLG